MMAGPHRIAFDASMVRSGGGVTYLTNLLPELQRQAPQWRFLLLLGDEGLAERLPRVANVELHRVDIRAPGRRAAFLFGGAGAIARRWGAELYFSVSEVLPWRTPAPRIASYRNPNVFRPAGELGFPLYQRLRLATLKFLARSAMRRSSRVLFVSRTSADWIGAELGMPASQQVVVHHGIDLALWQGDAGERPQARPYLLSVSSIYRYKNFVRLIDAWTRLARQRPELPDLVILGDDQDPPYRRQMEAARAAAGELAERIRILGEVRYAEVRRYYRHAEAFVFPSYLETFGHPLLEAMASGLPLLAADTPVSREIAGDAALYFDPHDSAALADALERVYVQPDLRRRMVEAGRRRVQDFGWDRSAEQLLTLFASVLSDTRC